MELSDIKLTSDKLTDSFLCSSYIRYLQPPLENGLCLQCVYFSYKPRSREVGTCSFHTPAKLANAFNHGCEHYTPRKEPIAITERKEREKDSKLPLDE